MFSSLNITKAKIFIDIISTFNLKPGFTLFVISDKLIKTYSKSIGVSIDFLLHSPDFIDIVKNHITYTKLDKHKKTRFVTLSNTSFVFDPIKLVIDDVRGNRYGIKLQDKIIESEYTAYTIKGILIQNQSPYSYLESLPKDPFQHVILVGDFKSKDIVKLCNISTTISKKCTDDFYIRLLEKLNIDVQNNNPKTTYEEFANNPLQWMVKNYSKRPWNWNDLSKNSSIAWKIIQDNPNKFYNWYNLSQNSSITWEIIQQNPNEKWDWSGLSANPNITWEIIQQNPDEKWNWYSLSQNPNITWKNVQDNPDKHWNWTELSINPNITWQNIKDNPDKPWNWDELSLNPNITWQIVQDNPDKKWNWNNLAENPSITWQIVQDNSDKNWNWFRLSENPNITWQIVQENIDKDWNWYFLSLNPNITWQIVQDNPNKPWKWTGLSENPNITWQIVQENIDEPWNWNNLSSKTN